jgi:hypothetical protein
MAEDAALAAGGEPFCEDCLLPVRLDEGDGGSRARQEVYPLLSCSKCLHYHNNGCVAISPDRYRESKKKWARTGGWLGGCEGCGSEYVRDAPVETPSQSIRCPFCLERVEEGNQFTLVSLHKSKATTSLASVATGPLSFAPHCGSCAPMSA